MAELAPAHPALPIDSLSTFLSEIVNWNHRVSLVSRRSTRSALKRLVDQSVSVWDAVVSNAEDHPPASFVDVGSGAGFPGVIWALIAPELEGLLIERRQRKAAFLQHAVRALGLGRLEVYAGDARDAALHSNWACRFDLATTFAVDEPEATIPVVRPLLRPGGVFVTIAGSSTRAPETASELSRVHSEPFGDAMIVMYRR